ncbi:hypothetical protein BKA70DRAFT_1437478 [Coprinopsis sp. MPI-PUGE-AT-0042]|nr:hypothetical protein BKA70DRAFT_1437478 [Coprinopsis sp. MPI-PUGE-AT-0042]
MYKVCSIWWTATALAAAFRASPEIVRILKGFPLRSLRNINGEWFGADAYLCPITISKQGVDTTIHGLFMTPPTQDHPDVWQAFRKVVNARAWTISSGLATFAEKEFKCSFCYAADHITHLCDYLTCPGFPVPTRFLNSRAVTGTTDAAPNDPFAELDNQQSLTNPAPYIQRGRGRGRGNHGGRGGRARGS